MARWDIQRILRLKCFTAMRAPREFTTDPMKSTGRRLLSGSLSCLLVRDLRSELSPTTRVNRMLSKCMTANNDSTAVRVGEELDLAALRNYLVAHLPVTSSAGVARVEIEQFPGGHSNLTYLIRYGAQEFVLRRPPVGPV